MTKKKDEAPQPAKKFIGIGGLPMVVEPTPPTIAAPVAEEHPMVEDGEK